MTGTLTSHNPATGEQIGAVALTDSAGLERAIEAAQRAFEGDWRRDMRARSRALAAWADALEEHADELGALIVSETGKVHAEAVGEVRATVDSARYNAGLARHVDGIGGALADGSIAYVEREPVGVSAFIVPWNAPMILLVRDLAPALAAGVTAVVKPSELTPLSTARVIELALEAGVPDGVLQMVFGGGEIGRALVEHPLVRAVAFTGSTDTGRLVMQSAAKDFTRVLLEMGGKSASVIFDDADVDAALSACLRSSFSIAGQFCMANSRLLVQRPIFDDVRDAVCARVRGLRVGLPQEAGSDLGPLISEAQLERVMGFVEIARAGGQIAVGGDRLELNGQRGAYMAPTVIAGDGIDERLKSDEIFGPVVSVEPFDDEAEALRSANISPYGLAGSVWTSDLNRAWRVARGLQAGTVWVNRYNAVFPEIPMGGTKQSGYGRTRGLEGIHAFTELKHINWGVAPPP